MLTLIIYPHDRCLVHHNYKEIAALVFGRCLGRIVKICAFFIETSKLKQKPQKIKGILYLIIFKAVLILNRVKDGK